MVQLRQIIRQIIHRERTALLDNLVCKTGSLQLRDVQHIAIINWSRLRESQRYSLYSA